MKFGESLKKNRLEQGMTQMMLAEKMGYITQYGDIDCALISRYENSKLCPRWDTVERFVAVLGKKLLIDIAEDM